MRLVLYVCLSLIIILAACNATLCASTIPELTPIETYNVEDNTLDGIGDLIGLAPFDAPFVLKGGLRVLAGFHLYELPSLLTVSSKLRSAQLEGNILVSNGLDTGVRTIEIVIFESDGIARPSDFQVPGSLVGSVSYHPPADEGTNFSFDATAAVQSLVSNGATHLGVRFEPVNVQASSVPTVGGITESPALIPAKLTITLIPEPSSQLLIVLGTAVLASVSRRKLRRQESNLRLSD